jgi:transcriptional regulator with XRE-family HTH domain
MDGRIRDQDAAERLGQNVLTARRRAGFSQEELGALAGLHRTEIGFVEGGRRLPRADTLIKLASALGVDAEELLAGVQWVVPAPSRPGHFSIRSRALRGGADAS